ncbi:hypothetical protein [Brevibacterium sp. CT2-23B]|uniref:hypothetical protein n=1 Tax=Brevibacterium sp. CT2-23B TaxID=2729630 RepID=UPI0015526D14|nr:hypothetical protein [Brevibacterium sp. CT2-23B]
MENIWGTVPDWIAAVGTAAAFLWAVFLYSQNLRDREIAQARLLSIVSPPAPLQMIAGTILPSELKIIALAGDLQTSTHRGTGRVSLVLKEAAVAVDFHLTSTSDESFFIESIDIVRKDGSVLSVPNYWPDLPPRTDYKVTVLFPEDETAAGKYRIRFRDASGRRWERYNSRPVYKLPRRSGS